MKELANKMEITGFCKNLENGDVQAELQGATDKIDYLISYMENLKRIKITQKYIEDQELNILEKEFLIQ